MRRTVQQQRESAKRERIGLAMQNLKVTETPKDLALWVTHDGMELFNGLFTDVIKASLKEAVTDIMKEFFTEIAEQQLKALNDQQVEDLVPPVEHIRAAQQEAEIQQAHQQVAVAEEKQQETVPPVPQPKRRRGNWSDEEDAIIIKHLHDADKPGEAFQLVFEEIPYRSEGGIRFRWYNKLKPELDQVLTD